jgi:ParB family transcriptional regulator, chromosome partitioning protein
MSQSRKARFGMAMTAGAESAAAAKDPYPAEERPSSGNWSRQAFNSLTKNIELAQAEAAKANEVQHQGILEGSIPIRIPSDKIKDVIGTDRVASLDDDDEGGSYAALLQNIKTRGLKTPIRVRPIDADWRPNPAFPRDVTGQKFALQSGRRRLQACKDLGIEPLCFVSFSGEDSARLDDLKERFFENTARKGLTVAEKLHSIGLIAKETMPTPQTQIADILGVNVAYVNRGLALVENLEELTARLGDLSRVTFDDITKALADIKSGKKGVSTSEDAVRSRERRKRLAAPLPFRSKETPLGVIKLKKTRSGGRSLSIEGNDLSDEKIEKIAAFIESLK